MKISDQISLAAKNLTRRPGRTALTVVGVVVGTCAVIVMISLGVAQSKSQEEMLAQWSDLTQIQVYGGGHKDGKELKINDEAVASFRSLPHVQTATPYSRAYNLQGNISAGRNDRYQAQIYNLMGAYPDALEPMGFQLTEGQWLTETSSIKSGTIRVLVGEGTGYNFEDTRKSQNSPKRYRYKGQTDANGNELPPFVDVNKDTLTLTLTDGNANGKTKTWKLDVVGTLQEDNSKGWWTQDVFLVSISDMKVLMEESSKLTKQKLETQTYDEINIKVDDVDNVDAVMEALKEMGYENLYSMTQERDQMKQQVLRSQMMLAGLAAVSLLVAALNIANTMTMAIYERTREIGVMKVLGCELANIRTMFLLESGAIGFVGGVIGAVISLLVSFVLNNLTAILSLLGQGGVDIGGMMGGNMYYYGAGSEVISIIPPWLLLAALAFATVIGLVSGLAPASRAVKISALAAIRHE